MALTERALQLILTFEGLNQPGKWPGGQSGITLGYGYDLGYTHPVDLRRDWGAYLVPDVLDRLAAVCLKRGAVAQREAPHLPDITIDPEAARTVLTQVTLPRFEHATRGAFGPGFELLPPDAAGALVSLVYNRGPALTGARRADMRTIREVCEHLAAAKPETRDVPAALAGIAGALRAMKRLWAGQGLGGLLLRREAEAQLVEQAAAAPPAAAGAGA